MVTSIADRLFDGSGAKNDLEEILDDLGVQYQSISWDHYDGSLELNSVPVEYRLPEEAQMAIRKAGFIKCYVNHVDKWETHYSWPVGDFIAVEGWRVSYPHRRGPGEKSVWVEKIVGTWPKDWVDTGYVQIKPALGTQETTKEK